MDGIEGNMGSFGQQTNTGRLSVFNKTLASWRPSRHLLLIPSVNGTLDCSVGLFSAAFIHLLRCLYHPPSSSTLSSIILYSFLLLLLLLLRLRSLLAG